MRGRGPVAALAASPTMVGAVTVLIVTVAVFLAYNANSGLPFVPTYRVTAQVPNAATLVPGNDVRIGGVRVGLVESVNPIQHEDGSVSAQLDLKLDRDAAPIPKDSTMIIRARSALGLKYLEIDKGTSSKGFREGSVIPLNRATPEPVEFDEVLSTFDSPTRTAIQQNLRGFGDALAGRGPSLNATFGKLKPVVTNLRPVANTLASPNTKIERFFSSLADLAGEVAPVAQEQAQMFGALDTTFGALADVARPYIEDTIEETPPTLDQGTKSLPVIRPFLDDSAKLFADLRPGARALRDTSPVIADALETGTPVLADSPKLNAQLAPTAQSLQAFNDNAGVRGGLSRLQKTIGFLSPTLKFVTPAQTTCKYVSLFARNVQGMFGYRLGDPATGTGQLFEVFQPVHGNNNEGSPSSKPANGGGADASNFLHSNPYPNTAAPGQTRECEAGNEPYLIGKKVIGNVPGNQGTKTANPRITSPTG
ncbi:hypothetical protein BH10ACT11_BH10ACT11_03080 [soil metagenome]